MSIVAKKYFMTVACQTTPTTSMPCTRLKKLYRMMINKNTWIFLQMLPAKTYIIHMRIVFLLLLDNVPKHSFAQ